MTAKLLIFSFHVVIIFLAAAYLASVAAAAKSKSTTTKFVKKPAVPHKWLNNDNYIAQLALLNAVIITQQPNPFFDDLWNGYKDRHNKKYASQGKEKQARTQFEVNYLKIVKHNIRFMMGESTFTMGMNALGDKSWEEVRKERNGFKAAQTSSSLSKKYHRDLNITITPAAIDYTSAMVPVKDQGQCGSCWAFSCVGIVEYQKNKLLGGVPSVNLAEQQLVDCSPKPGPGLDGCDGGDPTVGISTIMSKKGIDTTSAYPYLSGSTKFASKCKFQSKKVGASIPSTAYPVFVAQGSESGLVNAIATIGPMSVSIDASHDSFQFYQSGVYNETMCGNTMNDIDHSVIAVGYNVTTDGKLVYNVRNSWGTSWGMGGYFYLPRNQNNSCGVATYALYILGVM